MILTASKKQIPQQKSNLCLKIGISVLLRPIPRGLVPKWSWQWPTQGKWGREKWTELYKLSCVYLKKKKTYTLFSRLYIDYNGWWSVWISINKLKQWDVFQANTKYVLHIIYFINTVTVEWMISSLRCNRSLPIPEVPTKAMTCFLKVLEAKELNHDSKITPSNIFTL